VNNLPHPSDGDHHRPPDRQPMPVCDCCQQQCADAFVTWGPVESPVVVCQACWLWIESPAVQS
jgi:hypothetical protein